MEIAMIIVTIAIGIPTIYFTYKQYRLSHDSKKEKYSYESRLVSISNTTALDRVLNTEKLRCAFTEYAPFSFRESSTGKLSGIAIEILEEVAKRLGVGVEWIEGVIWSNMIDGLNQEKYDIVSYVWKTKSRENLASFLLPFHNSRIGIYVKKEDTKFDRDSSFEKLLGNINHRSVKISVIKGEISDIITSSLFPRATVNYIPSYSNIYQLIAELVDGNSDVAFVEPYLAYHYSKRAPEQIENVAEDNLIIQPGSFMIKKGESGLQNALNFILIELLNDGIIKKIIQKYELEPGLLYWHYDAKRRGILL